MADPDPRPTGAPAGAATDMHAQRRLTAAAVAAPVLAAAAAAGLLGADAVTPFGAVAVTAAGGILGVVLVARRVGRRLKTLRLEVQEAEERNRVFRRSAGIGMFQWVLDEPAPTGSPEYFDMMGMPRDKRSFTVEEWRERVHPDDRERASAAVTALIEEGAPYDVEFRTIQRDGSVRWFANRAVLFRRPDGRPDRVLGAMLDIDDLKRAEAAVRERERRFRAMADDAPVMIWTSDADGRVTFVSRYGQTFTGVPEAEVLNDGWTRMIHPADLPTVMECRRQAYLERRPYSFDTRARRHDGVYRWMLATATPRFEDDVFVGYIGTLLDIADRKLAEERHALLMREVDHRAKNVLSLVISVLRVTRAETVEGYVAAVEGRVEAMARAHVLLAESRWMGAPLRRLVEDELGGYLEAPGQVTLDGPDLALLADAVQPMTIVLHELVTNAAKHGALSTAAGTLAVTWERTAAGGLDLTWRETAGAPVSAPSRHGFGRVLMESLVGRQLDGTIAFTWEPQGLSCRIRLPGTFVTGRQADVAEDPTVETGTAPPPPESQAGKRVLVVEDDVLVALGIEQILAELKYGVLGPAYSVEEALELLEEETPDAALLDMNLGGVLSTAVARRLRSRNIRFAYCTGYGERGDVEVEAPTLIKPVSAGQLSKMVGSLVATQGANGSGGARTGAPHWRHRTTISERRRRRP